MNTKQLASPDTDFLAAVKEQERRLYRILELGSALRERMLTVRVRAGAGADPRPLRAQLELCAPQIRELKRLAREL